MGTHKSTDYKLSAVKYYLKNKDNGVSLKDACDIYINVLNLVWLGGLIDI